MPLQVAGGFPLLLQSSPDQTARQMLQGDRRVFIEAVKSLKPQHSRVVPVMVQNLSVQDVDDQCFILGSTRDKGLHIGLASIQWNLPHIQAIRQSRRDIVP